MSEQTAVLIINDEPGIGELLSRELRQDGFEVETVENGPQAMAAVKRRRFDVVVTDLKLSENDGSAVVEALRALDPNIEVIVATGYASVDSAVACMKSGAFDYIRKPYDVGQLKVLLERALQKSHLHDVVGLYEASRTLLSTLKQSDLVSMVMKVTARVLRADDIGLLLGSGESETFDIQGLNPESLREENLLEDLAERVRAAGRAMCLSAATEAVHVGGVEEDHDGAALVYPLCARGKTLGALAVFRGPSSPCFAPAEVQRGNIFANQLALSLDNAMLYESLGQQMAELVETREQLMQSEKLVLAGQLASSVAHEVNNPLSFLGPNLEVIGDYTQKVEELWCAAQSAATYLRHQATPDSDAHATRLSAIYGDQERTEALVRDIAKVIEGSLTGVRRIGELVKGFTRLAESQMASACETVDLAALVKESVSTNDGWAARRGKLYVDGAGPLWASVGRNDLQVALRNVLTFVCAKERKRTTDRGALAIRVTTYDGAPSVDILDETLVLSEEEKRRVFDPRIEMDNEGSRSMRLNLGLAMSYQMLRRHGAQIRTDRLDGNGFSMSIVLKGAA